MDETMGEVSRRFFEFVESEKLSNADISTTTGIATATVSHLKSGRNKMSLAVYAKILESYPYLNSDWLLNGNGSMYKDGKQQNLFNITNEDFGSLSPSSKPEDRNIHSTNIPIHKDITEDKIYNKPESNYTTKLEISRIIVFYSDGSFQELTP